MPEVKLLHMADMHLEWPFAGTGVDRRRGRLRRVELREIFSEIIDLAKREQVQVLLIAGDLFEHAHAARSLIDFIDQQFRRIPEVQVLISPGNHDPYMEGSYYKTYPWSPNVHIFGPEPERIDLPDLPVSVWGWGFASWEVGTWQLEGVRAVAPDRVTLALLHGGEGPYHSFRPTDLASLGADYIALGHIHKGQPLLEEAGQIRARYAGSPEALSFGEPGEHGVWLGTVSKQRTDLRFVRTGRRQYVTAEVSIDGARTPEEVIEALRGVGDTGARLRHCYRLILTGAISPDLTLDLSVLQEQVGGDFYFLRLEDRTFPDYDLDRLTVEKSARGLFVRRLLEMQEAEPPEKQELIRRALALGLSAFAGRGVGR